MIYVERAGAEDLETIIAIQRASFKAVYEKYQDQYDPYLEERERIRWKLVERPNSFYYFIKDAEKILGFIRLNTNDEQTAGWIGTVAILPQYQNKGYGSEGLGLIEETFSTIHNGICARFCRIKAWWLFMRKTAIIRPIRSPKKRAWIWSI